MSIQERISRLERKVRCLNCNDNGGDFDQENVNVVHTFTLDDIGATGEEDETTLNQLITDYINSQGIVQGETENHYFILVDGNDGGGGAGDYIPLSGTEEGKPVTGHLQLDGEPYVSIYSGNIDGGEKFASINFYKNIDVNGNYGLDFGADAYDWEGYSYANWAFGTGACEDELTEIKYNGFEIQTTNDGNGGLGVGLFSNDDYSDVAPSNNLIYAQRSYVNKANSYSKEETKTGGTWIDGKPIYRKVIEGTLGTFGEAEVIFIGVDEIDVVISKFIYTRGNDGLSAIEFAEDGFTHLAVRYDNINQSFNIISKPDKAGNSYFLTVEYTKTTD